MKPHVRAAVAGIALSHANNKKISSVYAYGAGYINIDADVSGDRVNGYDYFNGCHIDGTLPNLYHYGESAHLEFKPKGNGKYDGYDYGSSQHFEITVRG